MERQINTDQGLCSAFRTETDILGLRKQLENAKWIVQTTRWLEAVKDPTRLKIVYLLHQQEQLCGCDLANVLNVTHSAISQHLRKLKDMELLSQKRQKQTLFYSLVDEDFKGFIETITESKRVIP